MDLPHSSDSSANKTWRESEKSEFSGTELCPSGRSVPPYGLVLPVKTSSVSFLHVSFRSERAYNIATDRSSVLAPLWGYPLPQLQDQLVPYGRYVPDVFVKWSILLNLFIALPVLIVDVFAFALNHASIMNLCCGVFAVFLLRESLVRLIRYSKGREITDSFLSFLIKPLYYLVFKDTPQQ